MYSRPHCSTRPGSDFPARVISSLEKQLRERRRQRLPHLFLESPLWEQSLSGAARRLIRSRSWVWREVTTEATCTSRETYSRTPIRSHSPKGAINLRQVHGFSVC